MRVRSPNRRHGYVLLSVLAVSVLVVTVLGNLAKISLRRGLDATHASRSLQQRWGAITLQRAMMDKAAQVFEQRDEILKELSTEIVPPPFIRDAVTINGVTFDLLLGDEDAKLNINALYHRVGLERAQRAIGNLIGPDVQPMIQLNPQVPPQAIAREQRTMSLSPEDSTAEQEALVDPFQSWGDVFDLAGLKAGFGSEMALPNVTTGITCWGTGQLNIDRASDQAILAVIGSVVQDGGARRILQRYRQSQTADLPILLTTEVRNQRDRDRLSQVVSESSTNFSLWISATSKNDRGLTRFVVSRRDDEGVTRFHQFAF